MVRGGHPLHLRAWNPRVTLRENLLALALTPGSLLLSDAQNLLSEELVDSPGYSRILAAVGRGKTRFGEIAAEAGQRVDAPLEILVRAGFLRRALPVGAPKGAKPFYEIADPYLAFWFACLHARQTEIDSGQGAAVFAALGPINPRGRRRTTGPRTRNRRARITHEARRRARRE